MNNAESFYIHCGIRYQWMRSAAVVRRFPGQHYNSCVAHSLIITALSPEMLDTTRFAEN